MRTHTTILAVLLCHGLLGQDLSQSVVTVTAATQGFDHYSPWKRGKVNKKLLTGLVITDDRILTLSHPLANHVLTEVCKHGSPRRYPADVIVKDYNNGLALLRVRDKRFFADLQPAVFAPSGPPAGRAVVTKWDRYGTFKRYPAEAFKTSIGFYGSGAAVLLHHMTTGLDAGGNGEPVFLNGKCIGITSYFNSEEKTIKVHAIDTIVRMLKDLEDGKYGGSPSFLFGQVFLKSDDNLRDYLGLTTEDTGVLVRGVYPKMSGHDTLKKNDVILSIDGHNIDDRGLYNSGVYGKLNFHGIVCLNHFVGDVLRMQIVRDKKKMEISFPLGRRSSNCYLIPVLDYDSPPDYLILGGLVFQELTEGYMSIWGSGWHKKANKRLLFLYDTVRLMPTPSRRRIVLLNRVLPASVNVGYHEKKNMVLLRVDGTSVRDLHQCRDLVASGKGRFVTLDFQGGDRVVLDRRRMDDSAPGIRKRYNITADSNIEAKGPAEVK